MSALAFKFIVVAALVGIAVSLCFYHRRAFLTECRSMSAKDARVIFGGIALMAIAALTGIWAIMTLPEWQRTVYSVLPLIVIAGYGLEVFLITRLPVQWKKSPLFWMAALPPVVGCLLVMLISLREQDVSR